MISKGKLIQLRACEPRDLELFYAWENDAEAFYTSENTVPFNKATLKEYLDHQHDIYADRQLRLVIETLDLRPVGILDLFDVDLIHRRAGVGILVHGAENQRKGYARDTLQSIEKYAHEGIGLHQLFCNIHSYNTKSIALFEKAGYQRSGVRKDWWFKNEAWHDVYFYQKFLPA